MTVCSAILIRLLSISAPQAEKVTHRSDGQGSRPYITNAFDRKPPADAAAEASSDASSDASENKDSSDDSGNNGQLGTIQLTIGTAGHGTFTKCKSQVS